MEQPIAEVALRALDFLVGEWTLEARSPGGEPWPGKGSVAFAWHDSGAHLVVRSSVDQPEAPDSISVIGCDAGNGTYYQLYSDDRGGCRVYDMSVGDHKWTLSRVGAPFPQRFTATVSADGATMIGLWEKAEDSTNYTADFELIYRRGSTE